MLSKRIEILVLPGSGRMAGPRRAPEKSMSRYLSAAAFFLEHLLALVRLPGVDHSKHVGLSIHVHDDQQVSNVTQPQSHEPRLVVGVRIFPGQREVIIRTVTASSEADPVGLKIRPRLWRVPLDPHRMSV